MLHYVRQGSGQPLVLVHGFLGSKDVFEEATKELAQHYDVIRVELPGHGQSAVEKEAYSVYDYADAVIDVLKHEGIDEVNWLGHSLGGYITLAALETKRFPIKRAILAYSSASPDNDEAKAKRDKQAADIREKGVDAYVDVSIANFLAPDADAAHVEKARAIGKQASAEGLIKALEAMKTRPDQRDLIETLTIPVLVLEGSEDGAVIPIDTNNRDVEKVITNTGHLGMIEDTDAFVAAVKDFLR